MDVKTGVRGNEWFPEAITKHINNYYAAHRSPSDWNVIHSSDREQSPVSFRRESYDLVAEPIEGNIHYGRQPADVLPTIPFYQVKQKIHLGRFGDRCVWSGIQWVSSVLNSSSTSSLSNGKSERARP